MRNGLLRPPRLSFIIHHSAFRIKSMHPPTLQLNKAHWPVTVLGPGRRIGLWVQGCTIGCRGCVSQDTWPSDATKSVAIRDLIAWCRRVSAGAPDGVTISGG